jgi:AcrR family transcriptional regulator
MRNKAAAKGTKEKILKTAAKMFSERGYDKVTTREIAKAVGINSASIYYHFPSKEDILKNLYGFYTEQRKSEYPDLDELLRLAETEAPHLVLMKSEFHYNPEMTEMLDQILVTAAGRVGGDELSERFIRENIFDSIENILRPLLSRMAELGKIKPFDIGLFLNILSYYCFSAAALNNSPFGQGIAEYQAAMSYMFSFVAAARAQ